MHNTGCLQCGTVGEVGYDGLCPACVEADPADEMAIKQHIANGHTKHCAQHLVWGDGECGCPVENFELRDPTELLETISRLIHGAQQTIGRE